MRLHYDEDFVEAAALLCASGRVKGIAPLQLARFNREREKLYRILEPEERNNAFFRLHLDWFREWGLESHLSAPLGEFPLLGAALRALVFRKALGRNDEGAELYVNEGSERTGVLAMRPERFDCEASLGPFVRHELTHLNDMVEPKFGYVPELPLWGAFQSQQRLARERYRLLWDVSIDGRLSQSGRQPIASREQHWSEFWGAFSFWTPEKQKAVFESLWTDRNPTHGNLAELACDQRLISSAGAPRPGAACPLCGFPTFSWAEVANLNTELAGAIQEEFPEWAPGQGACARCAALYRVKRAQVSLEVS